MTAKGEIASHHYTVNSSTRNDDKKTFIIFISMERGGCIYIMTNKNNTTLYVGVTSNLFGRVTEHKEGAYPKSFTARYSLHKLVYYEGFHSIEEAIAREKQIKGGSRTDKERLINSINPDWKDLFEEVKNW